MYHQILINVYNNTCVLFHSLYASGVQAEVSWVSELLSRCWPGLQSHQRLNWGNSCLQAQVVGRIHFPAAPGLWTSVSCWLLTGGHPQLQEATHSSLSCGFPNLTTSKPAKERISCKTEVKMPCIIIVEVTSISLAIFYWLKASHRSCPLSREGNHRNCWTLGGGDRGDHLMSLSATRHKFYVCCKWVYYYGNSWSGGTL